MYKSLILDLNDIQSELRHKSFLPSKEVLGQTRQFFGTREHGYRQIDSFIFLHVLDFETLSSYSLTMARRDLICIQITIKGSYHRSVGDRVELVNSSLIQITNFPRSTSDTELGVKLRGVMIVCDRQYFLDHFGLRPDSVPAAYKPTFLTATGMANAFRIPTSPSIINAADQIISCKYEEPLKTVYLKAKTIEIICDIVSQINSLPLGRGANLRPRQGKAQAIEMAAAIYRRQIYNPPTVEQMAFRVGLNRNELTIGFRELFGATPHAYAQALRMEQAQTLLDNGPLSISEVARQVGYEGYSSFSRAYHAHYGFAPSLPDPRRDS